MGALDPVAFDIETSGLDADAVVTVAGFAHELRNCLVLNTGGRDADAHRLADGLEACTATRTDLTVVADEAALLAELGRFVDAHLDADTHYLTAYNGETWNGGFDLPFIRSACLRAGAAWPFDELAYADTMQVVERFATGEAADLEGVYAALVGAETCDPFEDSAAAVQAYEDGDWLPLLKHNLADIERTRELAALAGQFVPSSDFRMKNLAPPG
jgi:uncharacterized protein YprB with RNaseH-like and TPR domain